MENRLTANSGAGNSQNCLYLFPLPISEDSGSRDYLGNGLRKLLLETKLIFAENERTARRFISSLKLGIRLEEIHIERFDKDRAVYTDGSCLNSNDECIAVAGAAAVQLGTGGLL